MPYKSYYILLPYVLLFFIAYALKGLRASACVCRTSENCKSLVLQDKCNIEIFLSPGHMHIGGGFQDYIEIRTLRLTLRLTFHRKSASKSWIRHLVTVIASY